VPPIQRDIFCAEGEEDGAGSDEGKGRSVEGGTMGISSVSTGCDKWQAANPAKSDTAMRSVLIVRFFDIPALLKYGKGSPLRILRYRFFIIVSGCDNRQTDDTPFISIYLP